MIWSTENLPCNGIACSCKDNKALERHQKLSSVLDGQKIKSPYYRNNHNLRDADILFEFTDEEMIEYQKSRLDILYFFYQTQKYKRKKLNLRVYQEKILKDTMKERFNLIVNSRQSGMNFTLAIKALYSAFYKFDNNVLIVSYNLESSQQILNFVKDIYQTLPFFIKPGIRSWTSKQIIFDNGSRIKASSGKHAGIGSTWEVVILNDYAHFPQKWKVSLFRALVPTLMAMNHSELLICSIPNGQDYFKELVEEENFFKKHRIHWSEVPERTEEWKNSQLKMLSIAQFAQEYENIFIGSKEWNRYNNLENLIN